MSLNDYRAMMDRCSSCLNCKWIPFDKIKTQRFGENCPSVCYNNFNTYSARGRFQLAHSIIDGEVDYTDTVVDVVHQCLSCGACDISCKLCRYNLEPLEHNIALKKDAIEKGKELSIQSEICERFNSQKTMIAGVEKKNRMKWAEDLHLKDALKEDVDILIFAGCKYSYDEALSGNLKEMTAALIDAGVRVGTLSAADMCCGGRMQQMGYEEKFELAAENMIKAMNLAKTKVIVTPCADCYYTFKRLYARLGLGIEVLHITEYIDKLLNEDKLKFVNSINMTMTYHDPCHLGRLGEPYIPWEGKEKKIFNQIHTWEPRRPRYNGAYGVYDAPRNILNKIDGLTLTEMERIREYSWCCGAGSCQQELNNDFANWIGGERLTEAASTGAEAVVTACPWCNDNLKTSVNEDGEPFKVYDILEIILRALKKEEK